MVEIGNRNSPLGLYQEFKCVSRQLTVRAFPVAFLFAPTPALVAFADFQNGREETDQVLDMSCSAIRSLQLCIDEIEAGKEPAIAGERRALLVDVIA